MTNNDIFSRVGHRTPYRVPDGYFAARTDYIIAAACVSPRRFVWRRFAGLAAAAAIAAVAVVGGFGALQKPDTGFDTVESAFDRLSYADQQHLLDIYEYVDNDTQYYDYY